ncbi:hypothetical protein KQX54_017364 [Cotesia glomerata]|uniref:Uncharacterized protein n=1 Tax=Cotesia glomerata TaxID=32391 RepID=A0AAV7I642_COTGL|nr:hypothetical protein KQX54_017364 [Cotesia glomerata]
MMIMKHEHSVALKRHTKKKITSQQLANSNKLNDKTIIHRINPLSYHWTLISQVILMINPSEPKECVSVARDGKSKWLYRECRVCDRRTCATKLCCRSLFSAVSTSSASQFTRSPPPFLRLRVYLL